MKNWADHCSSDEESIDGIDDVAEQVQVQTLEEEAAPAPVVEGEAAPAAPRTYEFPSSPPFTAFIGNLAYSVKEPEELKEAVIKCASEHLGKELVILGARISFDRNGKHRGFGYLELDTLEEVRVVLTVE